MAKKTKGARKGGSRGTRKTAASRGGARKRSVRRAQTGLENPHEINLTPLKAQIWAHIRRIEKVGPVSLQTEQVLKTLQVAAKELSSPCGPTMVISLVPLTLK